MEKIAIDIMVFDGGELVGQKFLHVGWKDATKSGVGGGYASKGNDCDVLEEIRRQQTVRL